MHLRNNAYSQFVIFTLCACIFTSSCRPVTSAIPVPSQTPQPTGLATSWLEVHFTDPSDPLAQNYTGGPDLSLAAAIDQAHLSVDMAAYSLNLWSIRNALLDAHRRGVQVRMVMESDNMDSNEVQTLIAAGIPVLGDRREGLMHDKFVIIDRREVWTGSMNFTVSGAYKDNNNLLEIRSPQVAEDYTTEFEEMFLDDKFGPQVAAKTPYPSVSVDGIRMEIYFSPDDGVARRILAIIQAARQSIYFMAYSFTSNAMGAALMERAEQGVEVQGVMDAEQVRSNQGTEYDPLKQAGMDVRLDGNADLMHHKVIIVDRSIVITGSYNFSESAETRNDENVVIIVDPEMSARYMQEYQRVVQQAQP